MDKTLIPILVLLIIILLIIILVPCIIGDILPRVSEKARAGDEQATFLVPILVFGMLGLLGIGGWIWTVKTGRVPKP